MNDTAANHSRLLIIDDNRSIHDDFRKILVRKEASSRLDEVSAEIFGEGPPVDACVGNNFQLDSAYQGRDGLALVKQAVGLDARYAMAWCFQICFIFVSSPTVRNALCSLWAA